MKYSLGLDIGTTSIGWAVINEDKKRIEDVGVRIFETPETPKGEPLAKPRRDARSARHRLQRRRQRLNYLKNFFVENNLLSKEQIKNLLNPAKEPRINPYEARNKGIKEKLSNEELFVALYHIAKRRGYKSNRKKVEEKGDESGKVLKAISSNKQYLEKYNSIGAALYSDKNFEAHKRNKTDSYTNSFIREDFKKEAQKILETQGWSKEKIDSLFHDPNKKYGGIFDQRPFITEELIAKMRGNCPFEKGEKRAWKASYTFELFRLTENLSHLEYNLGNKLTPEQIADVVNAAKTTQRITYKKVREVIGYKSVPDFKFDYIRGKQKEIYDETEKNEFCCLKFYHEVKKALTDSDFQKAEQNIKLFDNIGYALTANKDDKKVETALKSLNLEKNSIKNLMELSYSGFAHLSIKALQKLTPHLLNGESYYDAIKAEYPNEANANLSGDKTFLPPLSESEQNQLTNPVVKRAIFQTRKVVNAIIKKHGSPYQIKIECTNQLAKSFDERRKLKKRQDENAEHNKERIEKLKELGIPESKITGQLIVKYRLREEQNCKCQYCGEPLGPEIFFDEKLTEIDHIIPFSRCGNDGLTNKALVCAGCNQEKKNLTPFEKWGSDEPRWKIISELARGTNIPYKKRDRILSEKLPKEDWNSHALNDTRYVMRFMSNYIKRNLKFSEETKGKQRVILPTGFITSYLRKMYHLGQKDRELNNCHHAVDACIIATVSQGQIQKFAKWNKYKELGAKSAKISFDENGEHIEVSKNDFKRITSELLPWERFDDEVLIRCGMRGDQEKIEDLTTFRDKFRDFKTYDKKFLNKIHPLVVSRLPKRNAKGSAHKDTIRSPKKTDDNRRLTRKRLSECTEADIDNSVLPESDKTFYEQLKSLLREKGEDALKEPIYKNNKKIDKNGHPLSPVSTIKVYSTEPSGILINHGTQFVNNGDTVCLDVWFDSEKQKYIFNPVYVHLFNSKKRRKDFENKYEFKFSIFPNDYIKLHFKNKNLEGYYVSYDVHSNVINLIKHNSPSKKSTDLLRPGVGTVQNVKLINISTLGDNYPWRGEP